MRQSSADTLYQCTCSRRQRCTVSSKNTAWKEELCLYYKMDAVLILKIGTGNVAFGLGEGDSATEPRHDIFSKLHVPLSSEAVVNTHTGLCLKCE